MPPFSIRQIDHVVLRASDPQRLVAFYRDVLGCALAHQQPAIGLFHLRAGSALIDIMDRSGRLASDGDLEPQRARRNLDHLCLRIDPFDADAILDHLAAHDVAVQPPARRFGAEGEGPSIYLFDPEGNMVELKGGAG
ncbi:VOC family protein [Ferrovibrio sp.]|uniref:VOC family protein n=1 Tax=Ferrovibrio sp. TaxID=1917215 RepID=UPI00311F027A